MSTNTVLNTFKIAKGTKAQILTAYNNGDISSTDFAIATDEDYVTSSELSTVATSGSYDDLTNKPTIPTVNNATLTIQKNGTTVNTFTANASTDVTANITVPTQASDIGAQATLVSGTNIKTVGGTSLLGSGDVAFPTVDQSYSGSSTNAQSGIAVKSAIDAAVSSVYKPGGSVTFSSLPTPGSTNEGYVYNVTNAFTTTSSFVEGAGVSYPAGTNVAVIITDQRNYYAWYLTTFSTLVYTTSATPSVGDAIYNFNFDLTGDTIKSVESDYSSILWKSDGATLTATRQSSDDTNSTTYKFDTLTGAFQPLLVSGTNIKTVNNQSILGSGNIDIQGGTDVEAFTTAEVQTIWDNVLPSSFSFIKGSGVTDYTINNQTYTSDESISLWDGEYTLTISTSLIHTGGLCINDATLGLTLSCSVIVSGSSITFSNGIYTVSGTSSTNFTLTFSSGGSMD